MLQFHWPLYIKLYSHHLDDSYEGNLSLNVELTHILHFKGFPFNLWDWFVVLVFVYMTVFQIDSVCWYGMASVYNTVNLIVAVV